MSAHLPFHKFQTIRETQKLQNRFRLSYVLNTKKNCAENIDDFKSKFCSVPAAVPAAAPAAAVREASSDSDSDFGDCGGVEPLHLE